MESEEWRVGSGEWGVGSEELGGESGQPRDWATGNRLMICLRLLKDCAEVDNMLYVPIK